MLNRAKVSGVHYGTLNCQALTYISEKRELWLYRPITENIQVLQDISIPLSPSYANSHGKVPFNFLHAFFFFFAAVDKTVFNISPASQRCLKLLYSFGKRAVIYWARHLSHVAQHQDIPSQWNTVLCLPPQKAELTGGKRCHLVTLQAVAPPPALPQAQGCLCVLSSQVFTFLLNCLGQINQRKGRQLYNLAIACKQIPRLS